MLLLPIIFYRLYFYKLAFLSESEKIYDASINRLTEEASSACGSPFGPAINGYSNHRLHLLGNSFEAARIARPQMAFPGQFTSKVLTYPRARMPTGCLGVTLMSAHARCLRNGVCQKF